MPGVPEEFEAFPRTFWRLKPCLSDARVTNFDGGGCIAADLRAAANSIEFGDLSRQLFAGRKGMAFRCRLEMARVRES